MVEYVWKAAHVFHRELSPDAAHWAWTRVQSILEGKSSKVAAAMRPATVAGLSSDTRKPVDTCADYLQKYAQYLHYDRYLAAGYPDRHRRGRRGVPVPGPRPDGVDRSPLAAGRRRGGPETVGRRASGDFDAYWDFHEAREYERNHAQRYADGIAPPVSEPPPSPASPRLRRVK